MAVPVLGLAVAAALAVADVATSKPARPTFVGLPGGGKMAPNDPRLKGSSSSSSSGYLGNIKNPKTDLEKAANKAFTGCGKGLNYITGGYASDCYALADKMGDVANKLGEGAEWVGDKLKFW